MNRVPVETGNMLGRTRSDGVTNSMLTGQPDAVISPSRLASEVVLGDNLDLLKQLPAGSVDLVYIDPPFGTGQVRRLETIRTGNGHRLRNGFGGRTYRFDAVSSHSYRDDMSLDEYLEFLYERLVEIHRVLATAGSLYLHLDIRSIHHARFMLDEIFGSEPSTRSSGPTTTAGGPAIDGPRSTTTSSGTPSRTAGRSTATRSTASRIWPPTSWDRRRRREGNSRPTSGG